METAQTLEENQPLTPEQQLPLTQEPSPEQRYDPSQMYSFTEATSDNGEPVEETPVETPATETPVVETTTQEPEELISLRERVQQLENQAPEVQYAIPDELVATITNPETFQDIVRIQTMNSADVIKQELKAANPWASTDEDLDALLRERFPDYDPEIPENYGMDSVTLKRFNFMADGQRSKMLEAATAELSEKIKSFAPAPTEEAPFDDAAFEAEVVAHVDNAIATYKAPELPVIEGYNLNVVVDMDKLRELAKSSSNGPFFVNEKNQLMPDVKAMADRLWYESLREQLKPMADALVRKAPEVAKEAFVRSLTHTPPPANAPLPDPNTYKNRQPGRYMGTQIGAISN